MIKSNPCKECGSIYHTAMYHKPRKPIKRTAIEVKPSEMFAHNKLPVFDEASGGFITVFTKPKRKKKTPRASAKDKAWSTFSMYIRVRDSLATTGTTDYCVCITCNERGDSDPKEFKHIQAGHAVGGRGNAVLFNEEITNGQCDYCNGQGRFGLSGDYGNYALALIKRYGLEHTEALQRLKGTTKVYKTHDFVEIEQRYKEKLAELIQFHA